MISRYVSPEKKFSNWYFGAHQAYKSNHSEMVIRQLGDIADHDRMMTVFQKALLSLQSLTPKTASHGIIYVDYGYSYAAVEGKNGLTLVSRQSAFNEVEYWKYDVSEQLGYSEENSDEDSPLDPLDLFVQWIDDPRDKLELFQDVFRKILQYFCDHLTCGGCVRLDIRQDRIFNYFSYLPVMVKNYNRLCHLKYFRTICI